MLNLFELSADFCHLNERLNRIYFLCNEPTAFNQILFDLTCRREI